MGSFQATDKPAPTATRVEQNTDRQVQERIYRQTKANVSAALTDRQALERRLRQLDEEWDIERALQTNFAVVNLVSITLGALLARPWFLLSGVAAGFMVEHAVKGWCPPLPFLRRLGFRTPREIDQERYALKALRGDFQDADAPEPKKTSHRHPRSPKQ